MPELFQPGQDPRKALRRHRERGPKRFGFTYEDIAKAAGVKPQTVRAAVTRGALDPNDLVSVSRFIQTRRS